MGIQPVIPFPGVPQETFKVIFEVTLCNTEEGVTFHFSDGRAPYSKQPEEVRLETVLLQGQAEAKGGIALIHDYTNRPPSLPFRR